MKNNIVKNIIETFFFEKNNNMNIVDVLLGRQMETGGVNHPI